MCAFLQGVLQIERHFVPCQEVRNGLVGKLLYRRHPFATQNRQFLERVLVKLDKLSHRWCFFRFIIRPRCLSEQHASRPALQGGRAFTFRHKPVHMRSSFFFVCFFMCLCGAVAAPVVIPLLLMLAWGMPAPGDLDMSFDEPAAGGFGTIVSP